MKDESAHKSRKVIVTKNRYSQVIITSEKIEFTEYGNFFDMSDWAYFGSHLDENHFKNMRVREIKEFYISESRPTMEVCSGWYRIDIRKMISQDNRTGGWFLRFIHSLKSEYFYLYER